jgi:hypothetical protein
MLAKQEEYHCSIVSSFNEQEEKDQILQKYFWHINPILIQSIIRTLSLDRGQTILDVGGGTMTPFPGSTCIIDWDPNGEKKQNNVFHVDLDYDVFPFQTNLFYFVYSRHTLEDIQNPRMVFQEMIRVSQCGIFETPSPMIEITIGADGSKSLRGYHHHRYIVWTEKETNTLFFLPKYPIIQEIIINEHFTKQCLYLLHHYPVYWNNYYRFDKTHLPNIRVLRHGIDFDILKDYARIINDAILKSFEHTNHFIREFCQ